MCVTADRSNAVNPEVEGSCWVACFLKERHDEASETAVNMQANIVLLGQAAKSSDIVLISVWEVDSRTDDLNNCSVSKLLSLHVSCGAP